MSGGNAIAETLVALLALAPFLVGIPLLGKQLDIKHKSYDAARYSIWEHTVWRSEGTSNRKSEEEISLEARDRALGDARSGLLPLDELRAQGITENTLWRDQTRARLLDYERNQAAIAIDHDERQAPVEVGYFFVPGVAHGEGAIAAAASILRVDDLDLNPRAFAAVDLEIGVRPVLSSFATEPRSLAHRDASTSRLSPILQRAAGAVLSDTWSSVDERAFRRRVDDVTVNELVELLELPARAIGMQALGKGRALFGEGQFAWEPELQPNSSTLPAEYIRER
jgi:hypothetical protein